MCVLCGGSLFVLLIHSKKPEVKEDKLLLDMLKVLTQYYEEPGKNIKEHVKKFKACKEHSALASYYEEEPTRIQISQSIKDNYIDLLMRTGEFIDNNIDVDPKKRKGEYLVQALIDVIDKDKEILDEQKFYILPDGDPVTKKSLLSINKVYLPSFLLGILYYVMMNISDNTKGADTYNKLCPPNKTKGGRRKYKANIGENSKRNIKIINSSEEYSEAELLSLKNQLTHLYINNILKEIKTDITKTPIVCSEIFQIDDNNKGMVYTLTTHDYKLALEFRDDFNNLIDVLKKHQNSNEINELNRLAENKLKFSHKWLGEIVKCDNNDLGNYINSIIDQVKCSSQICINDVTFYKKERPKPASLKYESLESLNLNLNLDYGYPIIRVLEYEAKEKEQSDQNKDE